MRIHGLQKMTLLDYPGRVACTVFTGGCNLRCPFCHNAPLVTHINAAEAMEEDEFFAFLATRKGLLDGVCITGGEPLMHRDVPSFIEKIRAMGFAVKLDTNGTYPEMLRTLTEAKAVDYVAMDIKNSFGKYPETVGVPDFDVSCIRESIGILMHGTVPYEFRTTVTAEYHTVDDIAAAARQIAGAERYFLQSFVDSGDLIGENIHAPDKETLRQMCASASEFVKNVQIRGV